MVLEMLADPKSPHTHHQVEFWHQIQTVALRLPLPRREDDYSRLPNQYRQRRMLLRAVC